MTESPDLPLEYEFIQPRTRTTELIPSVFILHGRGANEQDLLPVARQFPDTLALVSLRAPDRLMGGYTWYDLNLSGGDLHASQPDPEEFQRSLNLVTEFVAEATPLFSFDPDRVGLFGFSQGAIMSFALVLDHPTDYAWATGSHGYLPDSHASRDPPGIENFPLFIGAGRADDIIPARRAEAAAKRFRELGCDVSYTVYDTGHGIGQAELTDLISWVETRLAE